MSFFEIDLRSIIVLVNKIVDKKKKKKDIELNFNKTENTKIDEQLPDSQEWTIIKSIKVNFEKSRKFVFSGNVI